MTENILVKIFEHNNWANDQIIRACYDLSDEQLDAVPQSTTKGSIRRTLTHLVSSQSGYLTLLTQSLESRREVRPVLDELRDAARASGEGFIDLARDTSGKLPRTQLQTHDNYLVDPWVVMVQAINHATEHREQIKSMLTTLGVTPPEIDGWDYGTATGALVPPSTDSKR